MASSTRYEILWLGVTALLVAAAKIAIYRLDPSFHFYVGDSNEYLRTASEAYLPPGRSWLYGHIVGWLTLPTQGTGDLSHLIHFQILFSGLTAVLLAVIARWGIGAGRFASTLTALLFALSPFGLYFERAILTEALGIYCFTLYIGATIGYVRTRNLWWVPIIAILSVPCIALRLAFLPLTLAAIVTVPIVTWFAARDLNTKQRRLGIISGILVGLASTLITHAGYKNLTGHLSNREAAYQYKDGWYLLIACSPFLKPEHAATEEMKTVIESVGVPLDRDNRTAHMWHEKGLHAIGWNTIGEPIDNEVARATALQTILMNPIEMAKNSLQNLAVYWTNEGRTKAIKEDLNSMFYARDPNSLNPTYTARVQQLYGIPNLPDLTETRNPTKRYFLKFAPGWSCLLTLAAPLLFVLCLIRPYEIPTPRATIALALLALGSLALVCGLTLVESFRLLYPIEPLFLLALAPVLTSILRRSPEPVI